MEKDNLILIIMENTIYIPWMKFVSWVQHLNNHTEVELDKGVKHTLLTTWP